MDPYQRQRRFIQTLWPYAEEFATQTGIPASWAVAMAANETGWDLENPVLFGIKGRGPGGASQEFPTWEVVGGQRVDVTSEFATYRDFREAFGHLAQEMGTQRYQGAPRTTAGEFASYLQGQGWATDPDYARKVAGLATTVERLAGEVPRPQVAARAEPMLPRVGVGVGAGMGAVPPEPVPGVPPTDIPSLEDELLEMERRVLTRVQESAIAQVYRAAMTQLATRRTQVQEQLEAAQRQLAEVRIPSPEDALLRLALMASKTVSETFLHVGYGPRAARGAIQDMPAVTSIYTPEREKQVTLAEQAVRGRLDQLQRVGLMEAFLAAAPGGWSSGDWSTDFDAGLRTFLTQSLGTQEAADAVLAELDQDELRLLRATWDTITQLPRPPEEAAFQAATDVLLTVPKARPMRAALLSKEELIRSLTGRAMPAMPEGISVVDYLALMAQRGLAPEEVALIRELSVGWRKTAEEYAVQRGTVEAYRAGLAQPELEQLSGWEYLQLGLVQPAYLGLEFISNFWIRNTQALMARTMLAGAGPLLTAGIYGAAGFGLGGPLGAAIGGVAGAGLGTIPQLAYGPELRRQYELLLQAQPPPEAGLPTVSEWDLARLAWEAVPGSDFLKMVAEAIYDPTNVIGIGFIPRTLGRVPVLGPRLFNVADRAWMRFWDTMTPPLIGGIAGGVATGGQAVGALVGAGLGTAYRATGLSAVRTFRQLATQRSVDAGRLVHVLASAFRRERIGAHAPPTTTPTAQDMESVAKLAIDTVRKDPTGDTNLHKLGLYVYEAGFTPPVLETTSVKGQMWRSIGNLARYLERPLPDKLQYHNILDALWSNIGRGTQYTRSEIVVRVGAALGMDDIALAKAVGRRGRKAGEAIAAWLRRYEENTFEAGLQPFKARKNVRAARALDNWMNQIRDNTMDWYRHPSRTTAEAEGIWGRLRVFKEGMDQSRLFNAVDRTNYAMAKQALLFFSYGPWNVAETMLRMALGNINPLGLWRRTAGRWLPSSWDTVHFLNELTTDLPNVRPFVKFDSDRELRTPVLMGAVPPSTQETMLGVRGKVLEGKDLPAGQRAPGFLHRVLDYIPGVSISVPGFLRDVVPGGERWATALERSWLGQHLPEHFWSLRHWNNLWENTGRKLQAWYLLQAWQKKLQEAAPGQYAALLRAVGSVWDVPELRQHLPNEMLAAIQTKVSGFALYGDPSLIHGLRLRPEDLTALNLRQKVLKALQAFPELGEPMTKSVIAALEAGDLRPGMPPERTKDFFDRLWVGWMDTTVPGRLEYQAFALDQVLNDILSFSPQDADEMFRSVRYLGDVLETCDHSLSEALEYATHRGDELTARERHKLWGVTWTAAERMAQRLDTGFRTSVRKVNALLEGAGNLPLDWSRVKWGKGISGQAKVFGKARSEEEVANELLAQDKIKRLVDALPVDVRLRIRHITVDPKRPVSYMQFHPDGTLTLNLRSLLAAGSPTTLYHEIAHDVLQQAANLGDTTFFIQCAEELIKGGSIRGREKIQPMLDALKAGVSDLSPTGPLEVLHEELADSWASYVSGGSLPVGLRSAFQEYFPFRLPNLRLAPEQVRLMRQYNAHLLSLTDAYRPVREAQRELHEKVFGKGGDRHLYPSYRDKVRNAWSRYQARRYEVKDLLMATEIALGQTYGLQTKRQALRVPPTGQLTPSDVASMYNQFPSQLIHDMIDQTTLQMQSKEAWVARHMTTANRLVGGTGKTLGDFGITPDALARVYDNLRISVGLDPTNTSPWAASQTWFDSMRQEVLGALSVAKLKPEAATALDTYLDDVARRMEELFGPAPAVPGAAVPGPQTTSPPPGSTPKEAPLAKLNPTGPNWGLGTPKMRGPYRYASGHEAVLIDDDGLLTVTGMDLIANSQGLQRLTVLLADETARMVLYLKETISAVFIGKFGGYTLSKGRFGQLNSGNMVVLNPWRTWMYIANLKAQGRLPHDALTHYTDFVVEAMAHELTHIQYYAHTPVSTRPQEEAWGQGYSNVIAAHLTELHSSARRLERKLKADQRIMEEIDAIGRWNYAQLGDIGPIGQFSKSDFDPATGFTSRAGVPMGALSQRLQLARGVPAGPGVPPGGGPGPTPTTGGAGPSPAPPRAAGDTGGLATTPGEMVPPPAQTVPPTPVPAPTIDRKAWQQVRQTAMDEANMQFARDFPDYDNMNLFDSFMRSIYPFWLYEANRYPWTIRTFVRRPAVAVNWARYMEASDEGYWQVPGTDMLQVNPLRGTVFAGGYSRLLRKDYPEYYDLFPQMPWEQVSNLSRMGFYPNVMLSTPVAMFGGLKPQTEYLPPYGQTFLGALATLPDGHFKSVILDNIFPDRYRDFRIRQVLNDRGYDGAYIHNKRMRGTPLTEEEQSLWNQSTNYVLGIAGTLDAQVGMFRLKSQERRQVYDALAQAQFVLSGIPPDAQERLRRWSAVTNTRLSDELQLDPLDQWLVREYVGADGKYRNWLRPQTTPLLPSLYGEMQSRTMSYYDEVDRIWQNARTDGFPIFDKEGNETGRTYSAAKLEADFKAGRLKADDYTHQMGQLMQQAQAATEAVGQSDYYRDLPKTRKQREEWLLKHGMPTPTYGPGQELLWEYYNLRPELRLDEDGAMRYDWDLYYAMVDALLNSMTPDTRQRMLARIQVEWTDTQRLYWEVNRRYLAGYRNVRNVVRERLTMDEQRVIERYQKADLAERKRLEEEQTEAGLSLVNQFNTSVRTMRENMRMLDPELDAWLLFWGKANKPLTDAAAARYNQLLATYRPGAERLAQ